MIKRVFLDLDGVIANFSKAACIYSDVPYPSNTLLCDEWLDEQTGEKLWKYCRGHNFWTSLELFPWAYTLRNMIATHTEEWIFLTKSSYDAGCYSGKYEWMQKYFKSDLNKLWIVNGDKSIACRGEGDLLIDDKLKNIVPWNRAGGVGYHWSEITPDYSKKEIERRLDEIKIILEK